MPSGNQAGWAQWCYHAMSLVTEEGGIGHRVPQDPQLEGAHRDQKNGEAQAPRTHNVWGRCGGHRLRQVHLPIPQIQEYGWYHLLECLSRDIMEILFNTNDSAINNQTEQQFMANIKRLAVWP